MSNWIIFLHRPPKLGIYVEMVQFLLKFFAVHHDFHWFWQPNFSPFMLKSWGVQVGSFEKSKWEIFERSELVSESDTLPPTPQPYLLAFRVQKLW